MNIKKLISWSIAILIIILLVIGAVKIVKKRKAEDAHTKTAVIYPINIPAALPKSGHIKTTLKYLAIVKNSQETTINSKFAGKINCIVPIGSFIKKGTIVVKIDNTPLKSKLKEINSNISAVKNGINADIINLQTLKDTHNRTKKLLKVKMASIEQFNLEKSKIADLDAKLKADREKLNSLFATKKEIKNDLTYADIKSPINGIVSAKFLNKGDNAFPGKPILKIAPEKGNYLFIPLTKRYKEIIYKNKIYKLISLHSTFNGIPAYKANIDNPNLATGEKVNIAVVTFDGNATLIPFNSILSINGKNYVFNTKGNPIKIDILATGQEGAVVKQALPKILIANPDILLKIKAGYPVKVEK